MAVASCSLRLTAGGFFVVLQYVYMTIKEPRRVQVILSKREHKRFFKRLVDQEKQASPLLRDLVHAWIEGRIQV